MRMEEIGANIYVETVYPGVNVGCIITEEGAICVDTPLLPGEAQRWRALIRSLGAKFVRFVVYTSGQQERILGTQYLVSELYAPRRQRSRPAQAVSRPVWAPSPRLETGLTPQLGKSVTTGTIVAQRLAWGQANEHRSDSFKQEIVDLVGDRDPDMVNLKVILPQITFDDRIKLYTGEVTVTLLAAAGGISWVWLPEQRVLFAGDTVVVGTHPPLTVIDIQEWLGALERLRREPQFQEAIVVPGRGPLCDTLASEPLAEYLRIACDRTQQVYRMGRPKADLSEVAAELLPLYPVVNGQRDRVQRQIKAALDGLYDKFKTADAEVM